MTYNFTQDERLTIIHLARKELKNFSKLVAGIDEGVLSQSEIDDYNEYMSELEGILSHLGSDIRREDFIEGEPKPEPEPPAKKKRVYDDPCL